MWSGVWNFGQGQGKEYDCTVAYLNILAFCCNCWSGPNLGMSCTPVIRWEPFPTRTEVIYVGANFQIPRVSIPVCLSLWPESWFLSLFLDCTKAVWRRPMKKDGGTSNRLGQVHETCWQWLSVANLTFSVELPPCLLQPPFFPALITMRQGN